eukprot:Skav236170  [mRNA]  locus=scaffold298:286174:289554:- [translate_table: standard]
MDTGLAEKIYVGNPYNCKGSGKSGEKGDKGGDWPPVNGAKTVAEVEAEMSKGKIERAKRSLDAGWCRLLPLAVVHKHSGMGCAVVSLSAAETREAIMCYAEKTFGRSPAGKLEMDIADVKVQLLVADWLKLVDWLKVLEEVM